MVKRARDTSRRLDSVFHALSDSTRRSILRDVASTEKSVSEIAKPYRVSLAAVSKHLKVLEGAGLIRREKRGSYQFVRTHAEPMREAEQWLVYFERFWNDRLDRLDEYLRGLQAKDKAHDAPP